MICANCQKPIPDDADFCKHCGAPAPFSAGINYHPETLFANEVVGGGGYSSGSSEKAMTEMEARLNEKLSGLASSRSPREILWSRIQTIAVLLLVAGMIGGALLLTSVSAKLEQIGAKLETAATAESEMKISLESLTKGQQAQEAILTTLSDSLTAQQTDETKTDDPTTLDYLLGVNLNYEVAGVAQKLDGMGMLPGDTFDLSLVAPWVPEREGFKLIGWNLKPDGSGRAYALDDEVGYLGFDAEIYAQWEQIEPATETSETPVG